MLAFIKDYRPAVLFLLGDICDWYALSRFCRDPKKRLGLKEEVGQTNSFLGRVRKAAGKKAKVYYIRGNHDLRLIRYLWQVASELSEMPGVQLPAMLDLEKNEMEDVADGWLEWRGVIWKHGEIVRQRAGYTATGEMDRTGMPGVSAHSHRLGHVFRRNHVGPLSWIESGCLCDLHPEYMEGRIPDWQQGLVYGTINDYPALHVAAIEDGVLRI
jgi:hypothetical protein